MDIYILRSDGAYVSFSGMTQDQITAMLATQGMICTFVDQATFAAANQPGSFH